MKLYFSPGACSLSPHIVLRETGAKFDLEQVNNQEKKTKSGVDYWSVNGKGQVPVLEFDNGDRLTEGPVIVQWIADQNPSAGLIPAAGKPERYRVQEWLNFTTSELHKGLCADLPADHAGRLQGHLQGKSRQASRLGRQAARRQAVPDGRHVHRGRRVSVHRAALVGPREARPQPVQERHGLYGSRRRRVPRCRRR